MFSSLNRRHLFKQVFTYEESDTGQKCQYSDTDAIITCVVVVVVKTNFLAFLRKVAFAAYTSEYDYCKELETRQKSFPGATWLPKLRKIVGMFSNKIRTKYLCILISFNIF